MAVYATDMNILKYVAPAFDKKEANLPQSVERDQRLAKLAEIKEAATGSSSH